MSLIKQHQALASVFSAHGENLARSEGLCADGVAAAVNAGTMVILGNPSHAGLQPLLVGQPSRIKINANIGTSSMRENISDEIEKLAVALAAGADTVMDLSIAGDLASIRKQILEACPRPVGTVPLYAVAQNDRAPENWST